MQFQRERDLNEKFTCVQNLGSYLDFNDPIESAVDLAKYIVHM